MISLLDVNVLIALFDRLHVHHQACQDWFSQHRQDGWATCPTTQNGCIRVVSQPTYPGRLAIVDIARRVRQATSASDHVFWSETHSLADDRAFDHSEMLSSKHLTDSHLLAVAVRKRGRLVTLDRNIKLKPVRSAASSNLVVLGGSESMPSSSP